MPDLDWVENRLGKKAVRLTPSTAQAIADHFGGKVSVYPRYGNTAVVRLTISKPGVGYWSAPAEGWVTEAGRHLSNCEWRQS